MSDQLEAQVGAQISEGFKRGDIISDKKQKLAIALRARSFEIAGHEIVYNRSRNNLSLKGYYWKMAGENGNGDWSFVYLGSNREEVARLEGWKPEWLN